MKSIDTAIADRLAEKQKLRNEQAIVIQEKQKQVEAFEQLAKNLFLDWLEKATELDVSDLDVEVNYQHHNLTIGVRLQFTNGHILLNNPVQILDGDYRPLKPSEYIEGTATKFHPVSLEHNNHWHAVHKSAYVDYEDFIDAVIYAKYGTSEPEQL